MNLAKDLENIIRNNVKYDNTAPWSYIVYQSKYLAHGETSLMKKYEKIKKFAEKNNGYCKISSDIHIVGENKVIKIEMNCDCVAAKAFDAIVEEKERPFVYLSIDENRVWSASMSFKSDSKNVVPFCEEKDYPVTLIFERTDMNGSGVFEKADCSNRKEFLENLNWLGKCGFTPWCLWDFDLEASNNTRLLEIFEAALDRRMEAAVQEMKNLDSQIEEAQNKSNNPRTDRVIDRESSREIDR